MIRLETHAKGLLLLPLGLEVFLLVEAAPMVSLLVIWGLVGHPILVRLEMLVRIVLVFLPSNHRLISHSVLADADPLGVNQNVTFEEVGGLDDRKLPVTLWVPSLTHLKISTR